MRKVSNLHIAYRWPRRSSSRDFVRNADVSSNGGERDRGSARRADRLVRAARAQMVLGAGAPPERTGPDQIGLNSLPLSSFSLFSRLIVIDH